MSCVYDLVVVGTELSEMNGSDTLIQSTSTERISPNNAEVDVASPLTRVLILRNVGVLLMFNSF